MAGFENSVMVAKNVNFDELGAKPHNGIINAAGKLPIGTGDSSPTPEILGGSLTSPDSSITFGYSSPNITAQVAGGSSTIKTITGNTGGPESPSSGNFNILGDGSITVVGSANTETVQLTGLTNHSVLVGAGTTTITKVAPSSTAGVALISSGSSSDPTFGTLFVVGGGTGITSTTANGVICGGSTSTSNLQNAGAGAAGQYLKSNGASALPSFVGLPSQASVASIALNTTISNVTGDGTLYFPIIFDTEFVDAGSNYSTGTGNFTAPTTGNYLINANITFSGLTALDTSGEIRIIINGSTFTRFQFNPGAIQVSGNYSVAISFLASLTATNTVSFGAVVAGSTKTVGIQGNSSGYQSTASFIFLG